MTDIGSINLLHTPLTKTAPRRGQANHSLSTLEPFESRLIYQHIYGQKSLRPLHICLIESLQERSTGKRPLKSSRPARAFQTPTQAPPTSRYMAAGPTRLSTRSRRRRSSIREPRSDIFSDMIQPISSEYGFRRSIR